MHFPSLIEKKRDGHALTTKEIKSLVEDFVVGDIPDYLVLKNQTLMAKEVMPHFREKPIQAESQPVEISTTV